MCKKSFFLRVIYITIARVTQAQFLPCVQAKFKAEMNFLVHSFTQRDYTPSKINRFNYSSAEKIGVNKMANSENIFQTGHLTVVWVTLWSFISFENQHPTALNLIFIRRNRRSFCFVCFAIKISSSRKSQAFEFRGICPRYNRNMQLEYF